MRRHRGWTALIALAVGLAACSTTEAEPRQEPGQPQRDRPNVLIIVSDDQRADGTMRAMPVTRRYFGKGGTTFTRAYATTPLCCPSRASIFSGRYAHNHDVRTNSDTNDLDQSTTLQRYLDDAGYKTAITGKYLNRWDRDRDPPHFDRWAIALELGYYKRDYNIEGDIREVNRYSGNFVRTRSLKYLREFETDDSAPWFLYVGTPAAHSPYTPAPRYKRTKVGPWHRTPAVDERNLSDKPPFIAKDRPAGLVRRRQLRTLRSADDLVASIFDRLRKDGELGNTLAIFLSDNGQLWGEHGVTGKRAPYTLSVKIPFYLRWPHKVDAGAVDRRMVAPLDIAPTIVEATGVSSDAVFDGRSLLGRGERDRMLLEHWGDAETRIPDWASLRTPRYQYVEYYDEGDGRIVFREYYDLQDDPWQLRNLLHDGEPGNDPDVGALSLRLAEDRRCVGPGCP